MRRKAEHEEVRFSDGILYSGSPFLTRVDAPNIHPRLKTVSVELIKQTTDGFSVWPGIAEEDLDSWPRKGSGSESASGNSLALATLIPK